MSRIASGALYAKAVGETRSRFRGAGPVAELEAEAQRLARASGEEGVLSVWVQAPNGSVLWSAGEKWDELHPAPGQAP